MKGLYLPPPHGELIAKGKQQLIVGPWKFDISPPVYICSGDYVYAKVLLGKPKEITQEEFAALRDRHRISDEELKARSRDPAWRGTLYAYPFQLIEVYDPPLRYRRKPGLWIDNVEFLDEPPKEIHAVRDIEHYDASKLPDDVLRDDWRLLIAHYARLKSGEKTPWPEALILQRAKEVAKELIKRDAVCFHPAAYSPHGRELFQRVQGMLQKEGIRMPTCLSKEEVGRITPEVLKGLPREKVRQLHRALHDTFAKTDINRELLFNAHRFLLDRMRELSIPHRKADELDSQTVAESRAYPISQLPLLIVTADAVSIAGSLVYGVSPNDLDVVVRSPVRLESLEEAIQSVSPLPCQFIYEEKGPNWDYVPIAHLALVPHGGELPERTLRLSLHGVDLGEIQTTVLQEGFLSASDGLLCLPHPDQGLMLKLERVFHDRPVLFGFGQRGEPLADLILLPRSELKAVQLPEDAFRRHYMALYSDWGQGMLEAVRLEPLRPFTPMKASKGYRVGEFTETDELYERWAKDYLDRKEPIVVQQKYDGIRLVIHRKGQQVAIFTEDKRRDRARIFPDIVQEVRSLPCDSCIMDTEFVLWERGRPIMRREMVGLVVGKEPYRGADIHVNVHDLLYLDGESLLDTPYIERLQKLRKLLSGDLKYLHFAEFKVAHNRKELDEAVKWAASQKGSEGAMLKVASSPYDITGESPRSLEWAKFKIVKEISVLIIGRMRKALPWASAGLKPPDEPLIGEEAVKAYQRLAQKSHTYLFRCAFRSNSHLIPIEKAAKLTPAELKLRWVVPGKPDPLTGKMVTGKRGAWRGTDDPALWEMGKGFTHRKAGEVAYGTTYAANVEGKVGDIITVAPVLVTKSKVDDHVVYSWMFPIIRNLEPSKHHPDTIEDVERLVKASEKHAELKAARRPSSRFPPFSDPGGKVSIAPALARLIPPHRRYVETCAGCLALLFAKPPSREEVANDLDRELIAAYKTIASLTLRDLNALARYTWRPDRGRFSWLRSWRPTRKLDRLYRFLYLKWTSYGGLGRSFLDIPSIPLQVRLERLANARARLRKVKFTSMDMLRAIKRFDSKDTFFFIDPPYSPRAAKWWSTPPSALKALTKMLLEIRGKFLLLLPDTEQMRQLLPSSDMPPHLRTLRQRVGFRGRTQGRTTRPLLAVMNYDPEVLEATREEQRKQAERIIGDWYLIKQPDGKAVPFAVQYHHRGVMTRRRLKEVVAQLKEASSRKEFEKAWREAELCRLKASPDAIRAELQKVDDARGDVSGAFAEFITKDPPASFEAVDLRATGNVGNVHVDLRLPHPSMRYISGSWTCDVVKIVFQDLNGKLTYFLRNRLMENRPGDQFLSQKKCDSTLCPDEEELTRYLLHHPEAVEEALSEFPEALLEARELEELFEAIQPMIWLRLVTPRRPVLEIPPGDVGATVETAGIFTWVAGGSVVYGTRKSDFHENWLFFDEVNASLFPRKPDLKAISGRWDWKLIPSSKRYAKAPEEEFWMGMHPWTEKGRLPYILTHSRRVEERKARKEHVEVVWNPTLLTTLLKLFPDALKGIDKELIQRKLEEFREKQGKRT